MRSSAIYITIMALVLSLACMSCRQELCYNHFPAIDLNLSWELEWERDYGMNHKDKWDSSFHRCEYDELRPCVPEWVKMISYFDDGHISERFFAPEGDRFNVDEGEECSILLYNGDTEYIILSDVASSLDARATATSRSRSGSSLQAIQELYQNSRTTNSPDVIYSAFVERTPRIASHEIKQLPIKMQPLVYTYLVSFEFEYGIEHVAFARGALGGMAEGVYLRTGVTTDESSIILFDCDVQADACRCQVRSFGVPGFPDSYFGRVASGTTGQSFTLNLEVRLINGKTENFNFDVTEQVKSQPRGGVIKVSGIKIEAPDTPPGSGSGFDVDVSGWDDDVVEITLPVSPPASE